MGKELLLIWDNMYIIWRLSENPLNELASLESCGSQFRFEKNDFNGILWLQDQ